MFAEERRNDTLELLLTAPVAEVWIVLAKLRCDLTLVMIGDVRGVDELRGVLASFGEPDWGPIHRLLALALHAALLVAVGVLDVEPDREPGRCRSAVARDVPDALVRRFGGYLLFPPSRSRWQSTSH